MDVNEQALWRDPEGFFVSGAARYRHEELMYSDTDFTPEERAMLADLEKDQGIPQRDDGQQQDQPGAQADASAQSQAADQQGQAGSANDGQQAASDQGAQGAQANPADQAGQQAGDAAAQQAEPERKHGDLRKALRAARRSEHQVREENERLRKENEALKAAQDRAKSETELSDDEIAQLEADFPGQAAALRKLNEQVKELKAMRPAAKAASAEPEFEPPILAPALQEIVDDIPDLLDMQHDPDRTRWDMAVAADAMLFRDPAWANKSDAERLAEAARIANERAGAKPAASAHQPSQQQSQGGKPQESRLDLALKRIEQAPQTQPASISDLRGGASPTSKSTPDYSRMSDDEIMSSLG